MTIQNIFNTSGLIINMAGAYMMFHFTPKIESRLFMYTEEEHRKMQQKDLLKNKMVRLGMLLLFIGFILQFAALFMTS
jgi:hypothetical protein